MKRVPLSIEKQTFVRTGTYPSYDKTNSTAFCFKIRLRAISSYISVGRLCRSKFHHRHLPPPCFSVHMLALHFANCGFINCHGSSQIIMYQYSTTTRKKRKHSIEVNVFRIRYSIPRALRYCFYFWIAFQCIKLLERMWAVKREDRVRPSVINRPTRPF